MKVLITGATGFVGSWLTRLLIKKGLSVRCLVRSDATNTELGKLAFEQCLGDITDPTDLLRATEGIDLVFHLAGVVGYTKTMRDLMERVNIGGTKNIIQACRTSKVRRLIHISSVATVGASTDGKSLLSESSPYNLTSYNLGYFETKREAEKLVLAAAASGHLDAVCVNPATIYGAGDANKGSRRTQVKVAKGTFPFYSGGGVNVVSVHDLVAAIYQASISGQCGERYILGGENILISELFRLIANAADVKPPSIFLPKPFVYSLGCLDVALAKFGFAGPINSESATISTLYHWFDNTKAKKELKLHVTPAQKCIEESVLWMKNNNFI